MTRASMGTCLLWAVLSAAIGCSGKIADGALGADDRAANGGGAGAASAVGNENGAPVDCSVAGPAPRRLFRLTAAQYDNTIADLFGLQGHWGEGFPADAVVNGFANNADALLMTPLLADKLAVASEDIAAKVDLVPFLSCSLASGDDACARGLIGQLGARVFRRPPTAADIDRYDALRKHASGFEPGLRLVLTAMLQSPHFLYRRELGSLGNGAAGQYALDDHEIASELSYLVWQSMPDDALFTAARAGELHTPEQIAMQLSRMLASQRARPMLRAFVIEWLGLGAIATVPKDELRFPELNAQVRASMLGEIERFVDHVMWQGDGTIASLLNEKQSFVDDTLSQFYGTPKSTQPADAQGFGPIEQADGRRGILTLGGVMLKHARSNDSSPVHRGRLVRERFLCQVPPPPPPGIVVQPPPLDPTKTARERYAAHSSLQPCAGCHRLMDRIGFAFEHFDGVGRYRSDDQGQPIDDSGEIVDSAHTDGSFKGVGELADKLAQSPDVRDCVARQWVRFAYGIDDEGEHACVVQRMQRAFAQGPSSFPRLIELWSQDDMLRVRAGEPDAAETPGGGEPNASADAGLDAGTRAPALPDAAAPSDTGKIELINDNDYGSGYCRTYRITNEGAASLSWSATFTLEGTLMQNWGSVVMGTTGTLTFHGADYNATLEPGASTELGLCVTR